MGSSKCATASSTRCAGTSLLHTILRRQRLQRVITAIVAHLVENVPEAAAHGVPGSLPRGRGLRGSGAPSFSRRKHIDASAHPDLVRPLEGSVHCILTPARIDELAPPPFTVAA